jgi:hypothetical protein
MNKNILAIIVSNGTMKLNLCDTIATIIEVESSLDDFFYTHMMKKRL